MKWIKAFFKSWGSFCLEIYLLLVLCERVTSLYGVAFLILALWFTVASHKKVFVRLIG